MRLHQHVRAALICALALLPLAALGQTMTTVNGTATAPATTATTTIPARTYTGSVMVNGKAQAVSVAAPASTASTPIAAQTLPFSIQVPTGTTTGGGTTAPCTVASGKNYCATAPVLSATSVAQGASLTITQKYYAAAAASNMSLDIEVWDAAGNHVCQMWQPGTTFTKGQTITAPVLTCAIPATAAVGTYSVILGVNASDGSNVFFNGSAATFAVPATTAGGGTTTPPGGGTTTPPGGGTTLPPPSGGLAIQVSGNHFIDGSGKTVQLRGVNISSLESAGIEAWTKNAQTGVIDYWGQQTPNWAAIKSWGVTAVRIPLNEAIWNGGSCVDPANWSGYGGNNTNSVTVSVDPQGAFHAVVKKTVDDATANGLYVILDLHFTAPGSYCPEMQQQFADTDNSLRFWTSLATAYKSYPNVLFELFNEPFADQQAISLGSGETVASAINTGNASFSNIWLPGINSPISVNWKPAGFQQMLNAIRATGATQPILASTNAYASDTGDWLKNHPTDTLNPSQVAAVWHAYPSGAGSLYTLVNCIKIGAEDEAACSARTKTSAQAIVAAGYPLVITEYGDNIGQSQFSSMLLPFADKAGMSYFAWTWDVWNSPAFVLITNADGTPNTFGQYVKTHYLCVAAGTVNCQ